MLAEEVDEISTLLQLNTDGLTVRIHKDKVSKLYEICAEWEKLTKLELEYADYDAMHLLDVNNYLATYVNSNKIKRKGSFEIYDDYVENDTYHKNPSACIIPLALQNYLINGIPVEDTILNHDNIYDFCYGVKKTRAFAWYPLKAELTVSVHKKINDIKNQRVIRYYQAEEGEGYTLFKLWHAKKKNGRIEQEGTLTKVSMGDSVEICQIIKSEDPKVYSNLNYDFYINKTNKILNELK